MHPERMRANLDATRGQILAEAATMALAPIVGKPQAHQMVERASRQARETGRRLHEVLLGDEPVVAQHFSSARMAAVFDPEAQLGAAAAFVDRVLARRRQRLEAR